MKLDGKVTDRDLGYARLMRVVKEISSTKGVDMGVFPEAGQSIIDRAVFNHFGTRRIPARPFLNFDGHEDELINTAEKALGAVLDGKLKPDRALNLIGMKGASIIKQRIVEIDTPPNAPSTIAKKGRNDPLRDTLAMQKAVTHKVR